MAKFLKAIANLSRPLSNVKNIALILLAFYLSKTEFNLILILSGFFSLSLVCSAFYIYNSICDFESDKTNANKRHYFQAVDYLDKKSFIIFLIFLTSGLTIGIFINIYFFLNLLMLSIVNFLYSWNYTRFKEKFILDILFGASLTFMFRFLAAWALFFQSLPPIMVLITIVLVKSAGYILYKDFDYQYLILKNIKNSTTVFSKKTKIFISASLLFLAFLFFIIMCLNSYLKINYIYTLPLKFLWFAIFMIPPIVVAYLSSFGKVKTKIRYLRIWGFLYWTIVMVIIFSLL